MTANTRLKVGLAFAIGGNLLFFTGWWFWMPWSGSVKAALTAILFWAPETGTLICIAMIGRENYERFKNLLLARWRKWRGKPEPEAQVKEETDGGTAQGDPLSAAAVGPEANVRAAPGVGSADIR